jgi:hypothetical protein
MDSMDKDAITIDEFCEQHLISRSYFYKLLRLGLGPDLMHVGGRKRISREAGEKWRRGCEAVVNEAAHQAAP